MRSGAACVHDALRDALVVEVEDLLAKDEVLEQRRPADSEAEAVLVVGDARAVVGGEVGGRRLSGAYLLMSFTAVRRRVR